LKIVLDCSNGAAYRIAPAVFAELGAEVITIGNEPNGFNINEGCGSTSPNGLRARVIEEQADLGIAFDGDGDRVVMVDDHGNLVDGDQLLYIMAVHAKEQGRLQGGVVGTLMTNFGMEHALLEQEIPFERANVGDRYVLQKLHENGWRYGGESSGHLLCLDYQTTGDAIVASLQVLQALLESGKTLHEWQSQFAKTPQVMINVKRSRAFDLDALPQIGEAIRATEEKLAGSGRVLLRPSGTEPVVRVMVEGQNPRLAATLAKELAVTVEEALNS